MEADLSRHQMELLELGKTEADLLVVTFLESIIESPQTGEGVELGGFGSIRLRDRKARQGRNPPSGESIQVPPKRVALFKLGKELRSKLIDEGWSSGLRLSCRPHIHYSQPQPAVLTAGLRSGDWHTYPEPAGSQVFQEVSRRRRTSGGGFHLPKPVHEWGMGLPVRPQGVVWVHPQ